MNKVEIEEDEIDLLALAGALWKKAWAIVLAVVIFGSATLMYSVLFITPLYKANVYMYVNSSAISLGSAKVSISQGEINAAQSLVKTYGVILKTRTTLEDVIARSGVDVSYDDLRGMVSSSSVEGTEVFSITVTSANPKEATLLANTIAEVLPEKIGSIVEGSSARIVDFAVQPTHKSSPSNSKNAILGAAVGFVLSCALIIINYLLNDKITDTDYLTQTFDIPVLAVIPDLSSRSSGSNYYKSTYTSYSRK